MVTNTLKNSVVKKKATSTGNTKKVVAKKVTTRTTTKAPAKALTSKVKPQSSAKKTTKVLVTSKTKAAKLKIKATKNSLTNANKKVANKAVQTKTAISKTKLAPTKALKTAADNTKANKSANVNTITEAEILRMADTQYMCHAQLDFFRNRLIESEQEILENAKKTTQAFQEQETNYIADPSDRATIEEEYALELRTRDRERKLLQKIRKALHMIETGEYGYCEDTGEPIGLKRLIARPTATLTIEAQERREQLQKHFADE